MSERHAIRPIRGALSAESWDRFAQGSSQVSDQPATGGMSQAAKAFRQARARRPLLIILPFYHRPDLARVVVDSLVACAQDIRDLEGEVILYNDSPRDALLAQALAELLIRARREFPCRLHTNPENLGFVRTANQGLEEAAARGMDALLLNSDTVVFPGAFKEMARVSRLDPMTGFVNPRSNNATLATLPFQDRYRHARPQAAHEAWRQIEGRLPEVSYVPTAVGFCLLITWTVLAEFGVFDEIYDVGYNEENDLVMRAGRRGYRAILANRAYVWHEGSASFQAGEQTNAREQVNRAKLAARYPEYWDFVQEHFRSPAYLAERLLGALIPREDGRLEVALDFSHFAPAHNGTFAAGRQLLESAVELWSHRFEVFVICSAEVYEFHRLHATGAERRDPAAPGLFAAIFRVGQPFHYDALQLLTNHGAVFGVYMLDTISMDCAPLATPRTAHIWGFTLEHADLVLATSELTADQLARRLSFGDEVVRGRCLHSLDLSDYRMEPDAEPPVEPGYVLVVGNHYWHKDVANTVNALAEALPQRRIVAVVGVDEARAAEMPPPVDEGRYAPRNIAPASNVIRMPAGEMTDGQVAALYANAEVVVFPSHYEGFGMPVLNALAAKRPVFVRPLPVFEEMERELGGEVNLHVYQTTQDLVSRLADPPAWRSAGASAGVAGDAVRAAREIGEALDAAIAKASYKRVVKRIGALQLARDYALLTSPRVIVQKEPPPPPTPKAFVARVVGRGAETLTAAFLRIPGMFETLRAVVHVLRALGLASRPTAA